MDLIIADRIRALNLDKTKEKAIVDIINRLIVTNSTIESNPLLVISENKKAIDILNGTGEGSVDYKIKQALSISEIN